MSVSRLLLVLLVSLVVTRPAYCANEREAIEKTAEACMDDGTDLEACRLLRGAKKDVEAWGQKLADAYGHNPAAFVLFAATQRKITINKALPIDLQNTLLVSPSDLLLQVRWDF